jgi:hypothetical protein
MGLTSSTQVDLLTIDNLGASERQICIEGCNRLRKMKTLTHVAVISG